MQSGQPRPISGKSPITRDNGYARFKGAGSVYCRAIRSAEALMAKAEQLGQNERCGRRGGQKDPARTTLVK